MEGQTTQSTGVDLQAEPGTQADWDQWLGSWIWRATHCLVESPDFNPSPKWIAGRLNISIEKAVEAIEGLERLGCIVKDGASYKVTSHWTLLTSKEVPKPRLLETHSKISMQINSMLTPDDIHGLRFFLANDELVGKYGPKIAELFKQMNDEGLEQKCSEVMAVQISFAHVTRKNEAGGLQ